jgi:hypothetical protein
MSDKTILQHITELVEEEQRLRNDTQRLGDHIERIRHIAQELDQCWDLLRQRRAKREFGEDPDTARPRDVDTVEKYR